MTCRIGINITGWMVKELRAGMGVLGLENERKVCQNFVAVII